LIKENMKIGRNEPCLCGSGKKYKKCCLGKKDWDTLIKRPDFTQHLSLRGKNTFFLNGVAKILGFDPDRPQIEWPLLKERVTPDCVVQIHQLIAMVWPHAGDLKRVLKETEGLSGLYSGDYTPDAITRSVTRHALYSDSILIFDPLIYPGSLRPEYDPIVHPERHVTQTIKSLYTWFSLTPLMRSGILKIIRSPADFDNDLRWYSFKAEEERVERHPELKKLLERDVEDIDLKSGEAGWMTQYIMLRHPDEKVIEILESDGRSREEINLFLQYREKLKERHPYYTEQRGAEFLAIPFGECYSITRLVAEMSGSFLLTDSQARWKMIEIDRREAKVDDSAWEPFAAAMENCSLKYLEDISLEDCLKLRSNGLLNRMRSFLRRVWAKSQVGNAFSRAIAEQFTAELSDEVAAAEEEWKHIDANLLKRFVRETVATAGVGPSIGLATVGWLAACILGVANLAEAQINRRSLPRKMPGAFFLKPKKTKQTK
jgi:hypothetical protein